MIIKLEQGLLEGGEDYSLTTGRKFYTFYGIPYGEPPIGERRFRPPIPAGKWTGTRDATMPHEWCVQSDMITQETVGSEDCLFVNVFTPEPPNPDTTLKPVMVHLCGGGYEYSTEHIAGSYDHLVEYDVIMVTISYRQFIFGYLNLNIPSCAGNCGCKDIVLALKWIKKNISGFGGDPNNVTLYGESAGGAMINLLSVSPMAKAGVALSPWAFNDDQVEAGFTVGRYLGFEGTDPEELVTFLRQQPSEALKDAARKLYKIFTQTHPFNVNLLFTPSREKFPEGAFLYEDPEILVKRAPPIPTIAGVAEKDGVVVLFMIESTEQLMRLKHDFTDVIKHNVPCHPSDVSIIAEEAKRFYLQDTMTDEVVESRLIDLFSDLLYMKFYESFEYVIRSSEPFYVFEFAYVGNLNESKLWPKNLPGYAGHGDENNYVSLCRGFFPDPRTDDTDKEMIKNMCTFYTNFARTGNPNSASSNQVRWTPHTLQNPCYLRIDTKLELTETEVFERGRAFWKNIWKTYIQK